ncbi:IclR family transcriptional regulator [Haloferax prahovense]|uniref:IclR family transcriptional regulator n=1 Tax=Haloferax TaxID=2251 RepID=UPI00209BEE79|nr:IclR family transcriptional regulator [Haloferax sp. AB510]MCO8267141.1 IclR family transcriptional regulator [Haloferax sp. AB510]
MTDDTQLLTTTNTSLAVIDALVQLDGATASEVGAELEMSESTVYKHLHTLSEHGYVVSHGGEYELGGRWYHLGMYVRNRSKVYELAGKYVTDLSERSNEESDFGVEENGRIVTFYNSVGSSASPSSRLNNYEYMHATAIGKAILARLPESRVDSIIDRWGLPELTEHTITSRAALDEELTRVREQGYAINDRESIPGKRVTGVVAEDPSGGIIGGFTISGPEYRTEDADLHRTFPDILRRVVSNFEDELESQELV